MTMNTQPVYERIPVVGSVVVSAANTNRDGTGTVVTVLTAGTDGTRIRRITIKATGTTTAGMVRLFIHDGTNFRLWKEVIVTAITPSAAIETFEEIIELFGEDALSLPTTYSLRASTHNAETFHVTAEGGNY